MSLLRPKRFGKVPDGLTPYHRDFLQWAKDSLDILIGEKRSQLDTANPPLSQAITFGDLENDIEVTKAARGIILKSTDGTRYRVTVENDGTLTTTVL